jgi:DHA1 family bicyclomycin/chloramphenicol resistance-like MFS transporter
LTPAAILGDFATLLRDRRWCSYTLCLGAAYSGLFAFLSGSSFVIIDFFGYPEQRFGLFFALVVLGYIVGTFSAGKLAGRLSTRTLVGYGSAIAAGAGAVMAALALARVDSVWAVVLPEAVFMLGAGIVMPQALAGGLAPYPHMAGTSSSLIGFSQMMLAAAAGILVGQFHDGTPLVMSLVIGASGAAALTGYLSMPPDYD